MAKLFTIVVFVPLTHADFVREIMGDAGGGLLGKYSHCSFSSRGVGRYLPLKGAKPHLGKLGQLQAVEEERIEIICQKDKVKKVVEAMKKVHPYEEVAYYIYPLVDENNL